MAADLTYPTLSQNPDVEGWQEEAASDPTVRCEFENGYAATRARFTTVPRKWSYTYRFLSNTDKTTLLAFELNSTHYGAEEFNWTNPIDAVPYVVKFAEPIKYALENTMANEWKVTVRLIEANPSSN
jgi:phage-related protein